MKNRFFFHLIFLFSTFWAFQMNAQSGNVEWDSVDIKGTLKLDTSKMRGTAIKFMGVDNTGKAVLGNPSTTVTNNNYGLSNGVRVLTYAITTDTSGIATVDLGASQPLRGFNVLATSAIVVYSDALLADDQRQLAYATLMTYNYQSDRFLQYKISTPIEAGVAIRSFKYSCPTVDNPNAECTTPQTVTTGTNRKVLITIIVSP